MQLKNFLNHGILDMTDVDGVLKTPLFTIILFPVFFVFGSNLIITRLFLTSLVLVCFYFFTRQSNNKFSTAFFIIAVLFQFHIFHYTHLALSEMLAIGFILLAYRAYTLSVERASKKHLLASCAFIAASYFTKLIFLYAAFIIPLSVCTEFLWTAREDRRSKLIQFAYASLFTLGFMALYFLIWYLPNHNFFHFVFQKQADFSAKKDMHSLLQRFSDNINYYRQDTYFSLNIYMLYLNALLLTILFFIRKKLQLKKLVPLIAFALFWLLFELLKYTNVYLPSRYILGSVIANFLLLSLILEVIIQRYDQLKKWGIVFTCILFSYNMFFYFQSLYRKSYELKEINDYFSHTDFGNKPVMGNWAASCTWNSKAYIKTLQKDYSGGKDLISLYKPKVIITETDEDDSNGIFGSQGINIKEHSDSTRTFIVNRWKLVVYWIKQ